MTIMQGINSGVVLALAPLIVTFVAASLGAAILCAAMAAKKKL